MYLGENGLKQFIKRIKNDIKGEIEKQSNNLAQYGIISGGDFNSMQMPGLYTMRSTTMNAPTSGQYHSLIVLKSDEGDYYQQIAVREGSDEVYVRNGDDEDWSDWVRLLRETDIIDSAMNATYAMRDKNGNIIADTYAKKSIYGDNATVAGENNDVENDRSAIVGGRNNYICYEEEQIADAAILGGIDNTIASYASVILGGSNNAAIGNNTAVVGGCHASADNNLSCVMGKYNKIMKTGASTNNQVGDVLVIGNGTGISNRSNALRVTYDGNVYGTKAFQSSGADYAEFIKPWADNNADNEDRVGYFVTVKDELLYIANEGDYIAGITSGNPSIVGNADEDYYWMYERDAFNRIIMEDMPEIVQKKDEKGNLIFDEETHDPVMVETGNMIVAARMKVAANYDPSLQNTYIERKYRKEWDYVGMLGVLPVRDDGTCEVGKFCKCSNMGIATIATERGFDTYMVIERIAENVVSVILK